METDQCLLLTAVVKSRPNLSDPFPITRGVQQGSVLSPTFFLIVMDKLLSQLKETSSGTSLCGLYLGGAAHADDVAPLHLQHLWPKSKVRSSTTFPWKMA